MLINTIAFGVIRLFRKILQEKSGAKIYRLEAGDQQVYISDIRKAKAEFGWEPAFTPADGLNKLIDWISKNESLFQNFSGKLREQKIFDKKMNNWKNKKLSKLTIVSPIFPPDIGGPASYVYELGQRLKSDFDITVITFCEGKANLMKGVSIHSIDPSRHGFWVDS